MNWLIINIVIWFWKKPFKTVSYSEFLCRLFAVIGTSRTPEEKLVSLNF